MDDLIKRQDAIDAINCNIVITGKRNAEEVASTIRTFVDRIKALPSAQPKTGGWIPVDSYSAYGGDEATWGAHGNPIAFYYCSECKEHAYAGEDGESLLTDFCPHCGARMEGGKE